MKKVLIDKQVIKLSKRDLTRAQKFASKRADSTDLYKRRGGFKIQDIVIGALGEIGAYEYLRRQGYAPSRPDFNIYEVKSKSFNADMMCASGAKFHVKSQGLRSAKLYGNSYLMQRSDKCVKCPDEFDLMIPTMVDLDKLEVTVYGIIPFDSITFGECKLEWLRKTKVAIYLADLGVE